MDDLPASVREIAEVIGREQALHLIQHLPRCYNKRNQANRVILYVPKRVDPDHRLVEILGWYDALRLVEAFGGEILHPANCAAIFRRERNWNVQQLVRRGYEIEYIAEVLEVTPRTIRNALAAAAA